VLSLSSLIDFLLDVLRDDATQAEFARDPSGTLAARGLADVTAEDVRDVQPMLADVGGVHRVHDTGGHVPVRSHSGQGGHEHDVVREIHQLTREFVVSRPVTYVTEQHTHNSFTEFRTDNSVHAGDGATVVQNSFNQDNDGVDNKGGTIEESVVGGRDVAGSGNDVEQTTVTGSGNVSHEDVETGSHNTTVTHDWDDAPDPGPSTITYAEPYGSGGDTFASGTVNDSYAVAPGAPPSDPGDLVGAEQP